MRIATPPPRSWRRYHPAQRRLRLALACAGASTGGAWGALSLSLVHDRHLGAVLAGQGTAGAVAALCVLLLSIPLGSLVGAMPLDLLSHAVGRRPAALVCATVMALGALVGIAAPGWGQVVAGLVCGTATGGLAIVTPKLAHELAQRGHARLVPRLAAVGPAGAGVALVAGELGARLAETETLVCGWLAPLLGALMLLMLVISLPETPHWYAAHGKVEAAHAALRRMTDPLEAAVGIDWVVMDAGMLGEQRALSAGDLRVDRVRRTIVVGAVLELIQVLPFGIAAICLTPAFLAVEGGGQAPLWAVVALAVGWLVAAAASRSRRPEHLVPAWVLAGTGVAAVGLTLLSVLDAVRGAGPTAVQALVVVVAVILVVAQYVCVAPACLGATDPLVPPWLLRSQRRAQAVARPVVQMVAVVVPVLMLAAGVPELVAVGVCLGAQVVALVMVLAALPRLSRALR